MACEMDVSAILNTTSFSDFVEVDVHNPKGGFMMFGTVIVSVTGAVLPDGDMFTKDPLYFQTIATVSYADVKRNQGTLVLLDLVRTKVHEALANLRTMLIGYRDGDPLKHGEGAAAIEIIVSRMSPSAGRTVFGEFDVAGLRACLARGKYKKEPV